MTRSLRVCLGSLMAFGLGLLMPVVGLWPSEPWDIVAFTVLSVGIPLVGLVSTLSFVARELPRLWGLAAQAVPRYWQSVLAVGLSFACFLSGWVLFLSPHSH